MIEIKIETGIIKRSTTAGKESQGNVSFMGGQLYIKNIDSKYKDGTYNDIVLEAAYAGERFGFSVSNIISAQSLAK